jgi:putative sterol carrier protein
MAKEKARIPGVVWATIAFVPWIVYWVLAGMGHTSAAILLGLGVSLAINGYRVAVRKIKTLDLVSLIFLGIGAWVTLVLGSDLLVFYGGVLSDATLSLVAWGSLLAGNPFTYDYAKEDWDEAFWNDPIFIKTNQIITAVWGLIFSAQALVGGTSLVMGLEGIPRIVLVAIIPRTLLVAGFLFSTWFPRWYPPRAAARNSHRPAIGISGDLTGLRLVEALPSTFDARAAGDLQATIQFYLDGDGGGAGYLGIESGHCVFYRGEADQPTLTIESPAEVWTAVARGERNGAEAFLSGAYQVSGDLGILIQLDKLFS